jgi:glycine/D-amino acid oxidase-like deaminating enzyme
MHDRVVVLGAGVIGSSIAYHLGLAGVQCTIVEQVTPASCASGKAGGFLAPNWGTRITERLSRASFSMHESLAKELGLSSYRRLRTLRIRDGDGSNNHVSWVDGAASELLDEESAQVDPAELSSALLGGARARGAVLKIGEVVGISTGVLDEDESSCARAVSGVRLASGEEISCDAVVVALGPWSCKVEEWLGVPLPMEGIWSTSLVYESDDPAGGSMAVVHSEPAALFVEEDTRGCHLEVFPRPNGDVYISGLGCSRIVPADALQCDELPPHAADQPDPSRVVAAERSLGEIASAFAGMASTRQQACMRPCAPDGMPTMGPLHGVRGAYVAAGHNAWGVLWAPITGKAMAECVIHGEPVCVSMRTLARSRDSYTSP